MNKGICLPNCNNRDWSQDEINGLVNLAPDTLLWILYDVPTEQRFNHKAVVKAYLDIHPDTRLILRMYADNILGKNPKDWAAECKSRADWAVS